MTEYSQQIDELICGVPNVYSSLPWHPPCVKNSKFLALKSYYLVIALPRRLSVHLLGVILVQHYANGKNHRVVDRSIYFTCSLRTQCTTPRWGTVRACHRSPPSFSCIWMRRRHSGGCHNFSLTRSMRCTVSLVGGQRCRTGRLCSTDSVGDAANLPPLRKRRAADVKHIPI